MNLTYKLVHDGERWLAECVESNAMGEGKTENEAVKSLETALRENMFRPDAIAPPSERETTPIVLNLARDDAHDAAVEPDGPGDAMLDAPSH